MAWIRTIEPGEAEGKLKPIYDAALQRAGRVYGIVKLMSLDPDMLRASLAFYLASTAAKHSPLPRWFRELIAVTVSRHNHCFY